MKVRKWLSVLLVLLLLLSLAGCGSNSADARYDADFAATYANSGGYAEEEGIYTDSATGSSSPSLPENRKLIRTVDMDVETDDMDSLLSGLNERISQLDGYVEERQIRNGSTRAVNRYRSADLTVRIPADKLDAFVEHVSGMSNVVSSNEDIQDVTLTYVATESRMKALQTEEERLLELMEQAENMSDLLEIEARLTDVRYELERVTSQLRTYDNQVDYATVRLYISEVKEYTVVEEQTVWQRIATGFVDSLKSVGNGFVELMVWITVNLPYLLIWAAVITGAVFLLRRIWRKRKTRAEKKPPFPTEMPENKPE